MGAWFRWIREIWLGRRLLGQVVERATAVVTAATVPLFTVSGGRILVTSIVGEITIVMQNLACNVRLQATPTVGSARAICQNLNIQAYALGDLLGITGVNTDAMLPPASGGSIEAQTMPVVVKAGTIALVGSAAPTGSIRWTLHYMPLDSGASVVAA